MDRRVVVERVLRGELVDAVGRDRARRRVLGDRQRGDVAVDRGRRREHDLLDAHRARVLEHVQRAAVVDLHVDQRVGHRVHDRDLRGEVDDALDRAVARGDRRERREDAVRDVARDDVEPVTPGVLSEVGAPAGSKIIEHDHAVSRAEQPVDGVRADEPRAAGNSD